MAEIPFRVINGAALLSVDPVSLSTSRLEHGTSLASRIDVAADASFSVGGFHDNSASLSTSRSAPGTSPASRTDEARGASSSVGGLHDGSVSLSTSPLEHVTSSASASLSTWMVLGMLGRALCDHPFFICVSVALRSMSRSLERERDFFPLPFLPFDTLARLNGLSPDAVSDFEDVSIGVVTGLNWMYGFRGQEFAFDKTTAAQRAAHDVMVAAALDLHSRLVDSFDSRVDGGCSNFENKGPAPRLDLVDTAVAVPDCAATCDPASLIRGVWAHQFCVRGWFSLGRRQVSSVSPDEYVALTVRQLEAGLLRLASSCKAGASVFPVGKAGGKQRVVWNGTRMSLAASRPPPPLHRADPACFGVLDLPSGFHLRATKRDCKTWFDQLAVCSDICDFFGRLRVTRAELVEEGLTCSETLACGAEDGLDSFVCTLSLADALLVVFLCAPVSFSEYLRGGRLG